MKIKITTLLVALITGLISANAAPPGIPINSLPFSISAPGTYVLTQDLTTGGVEQAIDIAANIPGPVTIDFQGHAITATSTSTLGISIEPTNAYPITIRNGTLTGFVIGIATFGSIPPPLNTNITIQKIIFNPSGWGVSPAWGVFFDVTGFSSIINCTFNGGTYGIEDNFSQGGNSFVNCTFNGGNNPLLNTGTNQPVILNSCQFGVSK